MPHYTINWSEDHSLIVEASSIEEAIKKTQNGETGDQDTLVDSHFDVNDCFECNPKSGFPVDVMQTFDDSWADF